jgi:hypothetical protein
MNAAFLVVVLAMATLAGCLGGHSTPGTSRSTPTLPQDQGTNPTLRQEKLQQDGTGDLLGTVRGENGLGLKGASVTLLGTALFRKTDDQGSFKFLDLKPGGYTLRSDADSHDSNQRQVQVLRGTVTRIEVTLHTAYYLHVTSCPRPGSPAESMDKNRTDPKDVGCPQFGPFMAAVRNQFKDSAPLGNAIVGGTTADLHIFLGTVLPDQVSIHIRLSAGAATCVGDGAARSITGTPADPGFQDFNVECTFTGSAKATDSLSLEVDVTAAASFRFGVSTDAPNNSHLALTTQ